MENQVQCPECKSYKVESFKFGAIKFGASCIIVALLMWYFFPGYHIVTIVMGLLGILCVFNGFKSNKEYKCKACNFKFEIGKVE